MSAVGFIWRRRDTPTLEFFRMTRQVDGISAVGRVVGRLRDEDISLVYEVRTDPSWVFRSARLTQFSAASPDRALEISRSSEGAWLVDGEARPDLSRCVEIDIAATPFTNTLPINRLGDALETETELTMAYISVPGLEVEPVDQRYRRLDPANGVRRYLYNGLFRQFEGVIDVDGDGLVLKYADTFERLEAGGN